MQRSRLLAAAVVAAGELGYANLSVSEIVGRSRVSRRTFYELFANREECLVAALDEVLETIAGELARAGLEGLPWVERVRGGLLVILSFLDREPVLARVCVIQSLAAGPLVLARREAALARLAAVVEEGRGEGARAATCTALTAEGLVGAACAIVHGRLSRPSSEPLTGLLGELVGMIVLPYLGGAAARREQTRPAPTPDPRATGHRLAGHEDPMQGLPMRLTYRTVRVLGCIEREPGASNRQVADAAGVQDQGQISKLLRRLEGLGLLVNTGDGAHLKGESNAWRLTSQGERFAQSIRMHTSRRREAA